MDKLQQEATWGDGIMLSFAVQVYGRPIEIMSADGNFSYVDMAEPSTGTEPIRLGLANSHCESIRKTDAEQFIIKSFSTVTSSGNTEYEKTLHPQQHDIDVSSSQSQVCRRKHIHSAYQLTDACAE